MLAKRGLSKLFRAKEKPQSQRFTRRQPKNCLNSLRTVHSKAKTLGQIGPESSPESSAKSLSHKLPSHPMPVKIRLVGRIFRILQFGLLEAKTRKVRRMWIFSCFTRKIQRQRDDNKNKIRSFEGGGIGAERKIVQNDVYRGKRHDNKILKVTILLSRDLLSLRRLLKISELIFWKGMRTTTFQFSESGDALHRPEFPDLFFTKLPFLWRSLPSPSFIECLPPFH